MLATDADALVALLTEDVTWSMPPLPHWYHGIAAVTDFAESSPTNEHYLGQRGLGMNCPKQSTLFCMLCRSSSLSSGPPLTGWPAVTKGALAEGCCRCVRGQLA